MAIVANLANSGGPIPNYSSAVDRDYCTHDRTNAGTPNAVLTPTFIGERVFDTTNKVRWRAIGVTNADWIPEEAEVT